MASFFEDVLSIQQFVIVALSGILGEVLDQIELGGEDRPCFEIASVRASAVSAGQRCSGRLLVILPETFRAFTSFLK